MSEEPLSILLVEDDPAHAEAIVRALADAPPTPRVTVASSLGEGRAALAQRHPSLVLADLNLADGKALDLLADHRERPPFPMLVMTSHGDEQSAVASIRAGAIDYVVKSPDTFRALPRTIERALREWQHLQDRWAAETARRDSEQRFRVLFEAAPDALLIHDADGLALDCNAAAEELLGLPRAAIVGSPLEAYAAERDQALGYALGRAHAAHAGRPLRLRITRGDGAARDVEVRSVPLAIGGARVTLSVARDLTSQIRAEEQRRRLEDQLAHAQRMEAIGRLAGGVAHDFNNLLTAILNCAEFILQDVRPGDPIHGDASEIRTAALRAASLTSQLLAFSRKQVMKPVVIDPNGLISDATRMLRRLIGEDTTLTFAPGDGVGPVKLDPSQMEQVLMNLAVNARDAMPEGGALSIETAEVEIDEAFCREHLAARRGTYVRIAVGDTGCGIAPGDLEHIWEPFFTTKEKGRGTGLGLPIVYGVVTQAGGFVLVSSKVGVGSTFTLYLPRVHESPSPEARQQPGELPRGHEAILLVEDELPVLSTTARFLRRLGFTVHTADRGGDALMMLLNDPDLAVDLLLTDVVLPTMNGRQLYERLRALRPGLRVLFMSGHPDDVIAQHGVLEPGVAFLQKPFSLEGLALMVREVLDAEQPA